MKKLFQFITSKSVEIELEMDSAIVGADYQTTRKPTLNRVK